ncbi:hypothetical protein BV20DRAFT_960800 [Pilatotrama ljubarskyi]|nr:hypothetical protein BV20DRAFT_960800 [Pilatotrama ljubarskyi]
MAVRCFQCKTGLGGRGSGSKHAKATGHVWQPGYYCTFCEATFSKYTKCKVHRKTCGARPVVPEAAPPVAPAIKQVSTTRAGTPSNSTQSDEDEARRGSRRTSISEIVSCHICREQFRDSETLALHHQEHVVPHPMPQRDDAVSSSVSGHREDAARPSQLAAPSSECDLKVACDVCQLEFTCSTALREHAASVSPCKRCSMCIPHAMMSLQEHYRMSAMHATCERCEVAFETFWECYEHGKSCAVRRVETDPGSVPGADGLGPPSSEFAHIPDKAALSAQSAAQTSTGSAAFSAIAEDSVAPSRRLAIARIEDAQMSSGERASHDDSHTGPLSGQPPQVTPAAYADPVQDTFRPEGPPVPASHHPGIPPEAQRSPLELDNTSDIDHRSSIIAIAALDLIALRYGTHAARRVARVMQDLAAAPAEGESDRAPKTAAEPHPAQDEVISLNTPTTLQMGISTPTERSYYGRQDRSPSVGVVSLKVANPPFERRPHTPNPSGSGLGKTKKLSNRSKARSQDERILPPGKTDGESAPIPPETPSWHCRSCMCDPCQDPAAAICGHIFCRQCFIRELTSHGTCPVCQKVFLLRLDVGAGT